MFPVFPSRFARRINPLRLASLLLVVATCGAFAGATSKPLYRLAGATTGQVLPASAAAAARHKNQAPLTGRITPLDRSSLAAIAALQRGSSVLLPLTDNETVAGTVNLVETDHGWTRFGGALTGAQGSFTLSTKGAQTEGLILRPDLQEAYRIETLSNGQTFLREVPIKAVASAYYPNAATVAGAPKTQAAVVTQPNAATFIVPTRNSRPTAVAQLLIDFTGPTITDPSYNGGATFTAGPPALTADQAVEIYQRVAEDFYPFNINVTTVPANYDNAPVGQRMRCIVSATDTPAPKTRGVALLNSFSQAGSGEFSDTVPCFAFSIVNAPSGQITPSAQFIAETISHEFGITLGLAERGSIFNEGLYAGQGDWAPIMGDSTAATVTQWSKGEYLGADNTDDELAIITSDENGFGYAADDAGSSPSQAGTLAPLNSTPNNTAVRQFGFIGTTGDVDTYLFTTKGGTVTLNANNASYGANGQFTATGSTYPNLDILLSITDARGNLVASSNPLGPLNAPLTTILAQGTYYASVTGVGFGDPATDGYSNYGSLGAYVISGTVPGLGVVLDPNFTFVSPNGGQETLVVSDVPNTTFDSPQYFTGDTLYLDFAITNDGDAPSSGSINTAVFVTNVTDPTHPGPEQPLGSVTTPAPFAVGTVDLTQDFNLGQFDAGTYLIRVRTDFGNAEEETNEDDNTVTRTITVVPPGPPVINSPLSATGQVGVAFSYTITATDNPATYTATGLPPGLTLKPGTNFITGTPTTAGQYNVLITASNNLGTDAETLVITIKPVSPVLTPGQSTRGVVGTPFTYQVTATNNPVAYSASALPPGLTINPQSGLISGTPTAAGNYVVTINATNDGGTSTATLTIQILLAQPLITSAPVASGQLATRFSFQVTSNDPTATFAAIGLPTGLTINATTGLISGIPAEEGTFAVRLFASNADQTGTATLTLTISDTPPVVGFGVVSLTTVPAGLDNVVAISAGEAHNLVLKGDGTVVAFGSDTLGQTNVPTGLQNVISVAAGGFHSLALKRDGTVVAWGTNGAGQISVPNGLDRVVAIAAGQSHSLALRSDGTVVAWGDNSYNQSNPPTGLTGVVAIAAGGVHSLALKDDGTVVAWGGDTAGQTDVPITLVGVQQLAAGADFSAYLLKGGTVTVIGSNNTAVKTVPIGLQGVVKIAAGGQHVLALRNDGTVVAWGTNTYGESVPPAALANVADITAGPTHSLALTQPGAPRIIGVLPVTPSAVEQGAIVLKAYAVGTGTLTYQWTYNGKDLAGQTNAFLQLNNLATTQTGSYAVRVTNAAGTVTSDAVTLNVAAGLPVVTLTASTPTVAVGGTATGVFTLTRTGDVSKTLTVNYSVKGSAANGTDFKVLKGVRVFKAGKASVKLLVYPYGDLGGAAQKKVKVTLLPAPAYTVGTTGAVTVTIVQ